MNKCKIVVIIVSALILSTSFVSAQILRDADYSFKNNQYEKALEDYKKGIKKISKNQIEVRRVTFQIAECYRIMGDLKRAEQQYLRLEKRNYQKDNPIILFHLGSIYNLRGEYDVALKYYKDFQKRVPEDTRIGSRIEGCLKAKMWMENPTRHEVENFKKLNTKGDEWAPRWGNPEKMNQILFTSNREGSIGKGTDQWTGMLFSDIYRTEKPRSKNTEWPGEWSPVLPADEAGALNSAVNEGEASANLKGGAIYFTKCPQDKKMVMGCYIYTSNKRGKSWSEPEILKMDFDSAYNYVHPFIMPDELTIYFASDKPGGYGGYDLYKATRTKKSGKFEKITNLGEFVNTSGQEVFPTMRNDSMLYFSSDGHVGMGGLDIFVSVAKNGVFQEAQNLMYPINSTWDDMSIIFDETDALDPLSKAAYMEKGYFSSNRSGGRGGDDIYYFLLRPLVYSLAGFVRDAGNRQYMDGVAIEIIGSDGSSYKTQTDVKGYYYFDKAKILPNTTYNITVKKDGYWDEGNTATQTTVGLTENTDLKQDFTLTPIPKEPILLPEILYDVARWDLKDQYKDSLLYLYNIMVKNPTIVVELRSHTDYRDTEERNAVLSQNRAQSAVDFLVTEKGIAPERIVPKGYGEYRPRKFDREFTHIYLGKTYTFPAGVELTEEYIKTLPAGQQESANALNRRTEFAVLRDDYVPKGDSISKVPRGGATIAVIQQRTLPISVSGEVVKGDCIANGKSLNYELAPKTAEIIMNYATATQFLKEMIITAEDFEDVSKAIKEEDGSIIENAILYLNEIRIGDEYAENVKVIVKKGITANFKIGEAFIQDEWGNFTIDKTKNLIIFDK